MFKTSSEPLIPFANDTFLPPKKNIVLAQQHVPKNVSKKKKKVNKKTRNNNKNKAGSTN